MKPIHRTGLLILLIVSFLPALGAQDLTASLGDFVRQDRAGSQNLSANAGQTNVGASEPTGLTDGMQFSFVLTERGGGTLATTHGFVNGAKFRLESQESKTADNPEGLYAVSVDGGRTIYTVNPARHEFTRADTEKLKAQVLEKLDALNKQTGLQIESPKVETLLGEPGDTLDGHPTRHYKVRISYTMHFLKSNVRHSYEEYQDLWMASDLERTGAPDILIYFRPTGDARIDDAWGRELAQMPGFPLRQVTLRTEVNEEGNSSVLRISREITGVRIGPVPEPLFVLPKDYKEVAGHEEFH